MKRIWVALACLALVVAVAGLSGCGERPASQGTTGVVSAAGATSINLGTQQTGIWVNGEGSVFAPPDVARLSLGVESQATTVADAQGQAAKAMDAVMKTLTGNGVASKDIQTQFFNIQRVTRFDQPTQREVFVGYRVSNTVSARIRAMDKVGTIIDAVTAAGGDLTRISGISFSIDDPTRLQETARQKAMANAQAKASQLASLGGVKLGKPTHINESSSIPSPRPLAISLAREAAVAPTTPISPGETQVIVNVQVVYAIID